METNEVVMRCQFIDSSDDLVPLVARIRAICGMLSVLDRWSGFAYPRGRCRRR